MPDEENRLNEPEADYQAFQMKIYSTFSEADEARFRYWATLSGVEHIQNSVKLIKQVYKDKLRKLKNKPFNMKIKSI